ncbi:MAG: S8 family serine peptidase [Candidatus Bipolaricaulia bacterium]
MHQMTQSLGRLLLGISLITMLAAPLATAQGFGGSPDLTITGVQISPESPQPGEQAKITLTITNQGEGDVARSARPGVEFLVSFGPKELSNLGLGLLTGVRIAKKTIRTDLEAGDSTQLTFNWTVVQLPKLQFIFKVDSPFNNVDEANEDNNRLDQTLTIQEKALNQWWLKDVKARGAWETTKGSDETVVAVIDSGMDIDHQEFQGNLWTNPEDGTHGWDIVDDRAPSNRRTPIGVHGTSVAGLVAARDDGQGVTGVAPDVQLMDLRVFPTFRVGGRAVASGAATEDVIEAINFAVEHGADVINLSLGSLCSVEQIPPRFQQFRDDFKAAIEAEHKAIQNAVSQGVTVVAAAGNNGTCVTYPAKFPEVIAVSATTKADEVAGYSSRGSPVWVGAPGGSLSFEEFVSQLELGFQQLVPKLDTLLISPYLRDNYGWFNGTSAAAPIVSGVVALMKSVDGDLTPQQIREVLAATAQDMGESGRDALFGHGRVDAQAAVECVANGLACIQ